MRVGAVDVGTNTCRLLVADCSETGLTVVAHDVVVTRLGAGVDASGRFDPEALRRTVAVLTRFGERLRDPAVERAGAVATSATRDAADRDGFLDAAERALGVRPTLITGDAEARLSFAGVTSSIGAALPVVVVDLGGGSTEFVLGGAEPSYVTSVDIGSVRLTERCLPDLPAAAPMVAAARAEADRVLGVVRLPDRPATVVGVGGTFTSLAAIALGLEVYDRRRVHGTTMSRAGLVALVDRLARMGVEETAEIPSLDPARAPVLLGGAIVAERALAACDHEELVVSESDILDGVALAVAEGSL